jgi:hypothetical protein
MAAKEGKTTNLSPLSFLLLLDTGSGIDYVNILTSLSIALLPISLYFRKIPIPILIFLVPF